MQRMRDFDATKTIFGEENYKKLKGEIKKLAANSRILDAGCGQGYAAEDLQKKHPKLEIHGADLIQPYRKKNLWCHREAKF